MLTGIIVFLYVVFIIFIFIALVYLIIKRVDEKDNESFEKRKN